MYKYLLFDADNTLLDFDKAEATALEKTLLKFPIGFNSEIRDLYHQINIDEWKKLELGRTTREKLKVDRFNRLYKHYGFNDDSIGTKTARMYENSLSDFGFLLDGAEQVIKSLYKKYDIYVVTNGSTSIQVSRMEKSGLNQYIKHTFISEEIGITKPDVKFFDYVLNYIGDMDKSKYIVIGDSFSSDISGAIASGIDSIWFTDSSNANGATYTVQNLKDILNIL